LRFPLSTFSQALAHELGHNVGLSHDFVKDPNDVRYDSKGKRCTNVGGIMDYAMSNEKDSSSWSSCSVEDFTKLMNQYPNCLSPSNSTDVPSSNGPGLSVLECQLPPAFSNLNGVHQLNLNGLFLNYRVLNRDISSP